MYGTGLTLSTKLIIVGRCCCTSVQKRVTFNPKSENVGTILKVQRFLYLYCVFVLYFFACCIWRKNIYHGLFVLSIQLYAICHIFLHCRSPTRSTRSWESKRLKGALTLRITSAEAFQLPFCPILPASTS